METKTQRRFAITGIVIGSLLTLAPLFGWVGTWYGITRSFSHLGSSGISDPHGLSGSIGTSLLYTAAGYFLFPVGVIILSLSIYLYCRLRASTPPPLPR